MNPEVVKKKLQWAMRQRLESAERDPFTDENIGRIAHEMMQVLNRHEKSQEEIMNRKQEGI